MAATQTIIPQGAYTTTQSSEELNTFGVGALVFLDVTAASGTGGLRLRLFANNVQINSEPDPIIAIGRYAYIFYPGVLSSALNFGPVQQIVSVPVFDPYSVQVFPLDGSVYTYSVMISFQD